MKALADAGTRRLVRIGGDIAGHGAVRRHLGATPRATASETEARVAAADGVPG